MIIAASIFFLLSLILEASVTTLPLVFLTLLCLTVIIRKEWVFALALFAGIILDAVSFRILGQSGIYFVISIFLVILYERKFETATKSFIFISSFLGSFGYLLLFSYGNLIILQAISSAIIGALIFSFLGKFKEKKQISNF